VTFKKPFSILLLLSSYRGIMDTLLQHNFSQCYDSMHGMTENPDTTGKEFNCIFIVIIKLQERLSSSECIQ
jgi:hypothetical protein